MSASVRARPAVHVRVAREPGELRGYYALRQHIFCDEQRLFEGSDRDADDTRALPLVCILPDARVIGVVRICEEAPGIWYGGRLGVASAYRGIFALHRALVTSAVTTACVLGAHRFFARVQAAKVPLLARLHFRALGQIHLRGLPHQLMEADLARHIGTEPARAHTVCEGAP